MGAPPIVGRPPATGASAHLSRLGAWWASLSPLARDITIVLLIKAVLLWLLWFAFFRQPVAPGMAMDAQAVAARLAAPASPTETRHAAD